MKIARRNLRKLIENVMSETRYRGRKYRDFPGGDPRVDTGDMGQTEYYKPADPIRGAGNIYKDIRSKESANDHGRRQIAHVIQALGLDRSKARELFQAMNTYGYMIDYNPSKMTITFENKADVSDPYILRVSHLKFAR